MLVMREGADFEGGRTSLQVMPWPYTRHLTDRELHAIYEYLRAIPSAQRAPRTGSPLQTSPGSPSARPGTDPGT